MESEEKWRKREEESLVSKRIRGPETESVGTVSTTGTEELLGEE